MPLIPLAGTILAAAFLIFLLGGVSITLLEVLTVVSLVIFLFALLAPYAGTYTRRAP